MNNDSKTQVYSYIISLERAKHRFNYAKYLTTKIKNMRLFSAIDYLNNPRFDELCCKYRVKINKGHAGCALSHIILLENFIISDQKYMIVLEDDCVINYPLPINNAQVEYMFNCIKLRSILQIDILYLNKRTLFNKYYRVIGGCGTEGYLVTKHGAKKLLASLIELDQPIDLRWLAHFPEYENKSALSPVYPKLSINAYHSHITIVDTKDSNISYVNGHIDNTDSDNVQTCK